MKSDGQLAFDFEELEREDARKNFSAWTGAPLHFTTDYYPPEDLVAAFEHWQFLYGTFGSYSRSHMWHPGFRGLDGGVRFEGHQITMFSAELRAEPEHEGPGELLSMSICEPCGWHKVSASENEVVEDWHDHAIPGWRELPVVPEQIRVTNEKGLTSLARKWIMANYPEEVQVAGMPIITKRERGLTRHVEGRSPWGGYDLSSTVLEAVDKPEPEEASVRRSTRLGEVNASDRRVREPLPSTSLGR